MHTVLSDDERFAVAGTDANVTISMKGTAGSVAPVALESARNNFERRQQDTFVVRAPDIGTLESVTIGHDGSGFASAWHLDSVGVHHPGTGAMRACAHQLCTARSAAGLNQHNVDNLTCAPA